VICELVGLNILPLFVGLMSGDVKFLFCVQMFGSVSPILNISEDDTEREPDFNKVWLILSSDSTLIFTCEDELRLTLSVVSASVVCVCVCVCACVRTRE